MRPEAGVAVAGDASNALRGEELALMQAALDADDLAALQRACAAPAAALRRQLRELLAYHLGPVPLRTRQVLLELQLLL